tara:strand:- start:1058 stop:1513 length:456 start_codon:yes stop_codon:yes gene_type:complete
MTKIDKNDINNINFLKKELKLKNIQKVKIKKDKYEIELSAIESIVNKTNIESSNENKKNIDKNLSDNKETNIKPENIVKSPMVGVAYLSPEPTSQPFIKTGQHVKQGDILLLIEAMKTFNEIKAPKSGVIQKIIVLNSQPVEFGDDLVIFE